MEKNKAKIKFIEKGKRVHCNENLDYSKVDYVNNRTPVIIIDHDLDENGNEYGEFSIMPGNFLKGQGHRGKRAKKISLSKRSKQEEIIERFKKVHKGENLDYSQVKYVNMHTKVKIISHDLRPDGTEYGEFWQEPAVHLSGCGCPICNESKLELIIQKLLKSNYIEYDQEKTFDWLKNDSYMFLDFYLPEYNIGIECQGIQHFNPIEYFGGNDAFESTRDRDILKQKLCKEHNIEILYYTDVKLEEYPYDVITDLNELIKRIKSY